MRRAPRWPEGRVGYPALVVIPMSPPAAPKPAPYLRLCRQWSGWSGFFLHGPTNVWPEVAR